MDLKRKKSWSFPRHAYTYIDSQAKYPWFKAHALYLVGSTEYYELLKPNETITGDRYQTQLTHLSRALKEKRPQFNERHDKVILQLNNARLHMLHHPSKPTRKLSNGKSYSTCRIHQTMLLPIITCFDRRRNALLLMKIPKIRSIRGSHQKMSSSSKMISVNCQKDGKKKGLTMDNSFRFLSCAPK